MSNDYAKGFKDGFAAGLEEGKKLVEERWRQDKIKEIEKSLPKPVTRLDDYVFGSTGSTGRCGVCGKDFGDGKIWGYVCNHARCPSRVTCGAVGATYDNMSSSYPVGMNGPTGSFNSPEYTNKVWINGQWAELGN